MPPARGPQTVIVVAVVAVVAVIHSSPYVSMGVHRCIYVFMDCRRNASKNSLVLSLPVEHSNGNSSSSSSSA